MAITNEEQNITRAIAENLKELPYYITEFYKEKKDVFSINTLSQYIYQYKQFFTRLHTDLIVKVDSPKDVPLDALDELPKNVVRTYFDKLTEENIASDKKKEHNVLEVRKDTSINNAKSALRSLFRYLAVEAEHESNKKSYIERNVIEKFPLKRIKEAPATRAAALNDKILKPQQIKGFLDFLYNEYEDIISDDYRKLGTFKRDKERDYAICSLFLGSGIRLAELVSLEVDNINFLTNRISIDRKGGGHESITVSVDSIIAIKHYLKVRNERYKGAQFSPFLFVTNHGGIKNISHRAIQNIVQKYTAVKKVTMSEDQKGISPHKLRHSFSLVYYENTGDIKLLSEQLGHSNLNTTSLYVNMADETREKAMERVSEAINNEDITNKD